MKIILKILSPIVVLTLIATSVVALSPRKECIRDSRDTYEKAKISAYSEYVDAIISAKQDKVDAYYDAYSQKEKSDRNEIKDQAKEDYADARKEAKDEYKDAVKDIKDDYKDSLKECKDLSNSNDDGSGDGGNNDNGGSGDNGNADGGSQQDDLKLSFKITENHYPVTPTIEVLLDKNRNYCKKYANKKGSVNIQFYLSGEMANGSKFNDGRGEIQWDCKDDLEYEFTSRIWWQPGKRYISTVPLVVSLWDMDRDIKITEQKVTVFPESPSITGSAEIWRLPQINVNIDIPDEHCKFKQSDRFKAVVKAFRPNFPGSSERQIIRSIPKELRCGSQSFIIKKSDDSEIYNYGTNFKVYAWEDRFWTPENYERYNEKGNFAFLIDIPICHPSSNTCR